MNYTGILIVLLLLAFVVIAVMFYEITQYEFEKKNLDRILEDIDNELNKLNGITTGIDEHTRRLELRAAKKILKEY